MKIVAGFLLGVSLLIGPNFGTSAAKAAIVDVSYAVSGSSGNWLLDFSVTNNLGGANSLYLFGVRMPDRDIDGSPSGWDPNEIISYNSLSNGGPNINFNNIWRTFPVGSPTVAPGETLSGFQVGSDDLMRPGDVSWFTFAAGGTYSGPGCAMNCTGANDNPGFVGVATERSTAVPEPTSWAMMILGFIAVGAITRRDLRRRCV